MTLLVVVLLLAAVASKIDCSTAFQPKVPLALLRHAPSFTTHASPRSGPEPRKSVRLKMSGNDDEGGDVGAGGKRPRREPLPIRRALLLSTVAALGTQVALAKVAPPGFKRIPTQFIAALGDPASSVGSGAENWGVWAEDPGPRGVWLSDYRRTLLPNDDGATTRTAPAGWEFDTQDWWLEEHGLIMEKPKSSVPPGRYLVTGGRLVTTPLTVYPPDPTTGEQRWSLDEGTLYDVTHLPCRSARYRPTTSTTTGGGGGGGGWGSPADARRSDFPVMPGAEMPNVDGCTKQDYAVLFVIGVEA